MLSLESSDPAAHRSLVAVKEHGILMTTYSTAMDNESNDQFWVIGYVYLGKTELNVSRLFN